MAMPQVDGWIPCTPLHPPLLSLSTFLPCGPWRDDVPFMVECPSVTCPQHCDQVCLHSFLIKEECGDLLSGWSHINKRNYIVLLIVQHSQDGSVDNVNINTYIFMKYQDVWFRCTLHDASVIPRLKASWLTLSDPFLAGSSCCVKRAIICGHLTAQQQQNFMLLPRSGSVLHHQSTSPSVSRSYPSALHCYEINAIWIPSEWGSHMLFVSLCLECFIYYIRSSPVTAMEQISLFLPFLRMNGISLCACMVFLYPLGLARAVEFLCLSRLLCLVLTVNGSVAVSLHRLHFLWLHLQSRATGFPNSSVFVLFWRSSIYFPTTTSVLIYILTGIGWGPIFPISHSTCYSW